MTITNGKLSAPEDHSLMRFCPLLVTLHLHLKEAAGTPDGLQTLNLDKPSPCCLKAFFSCPFPYHLSSYEGLQRKILCDGCNQLLPHLAQNQGPHATSWPLIADGEKLPCRAAEQHRDPGVKQ